MTQDEIIEMAKKAGFTIDDECYIRFAKLVAEREREECAKICEQMDDEDEGPDVWDWNSKDYAKAIRARQ